MGVDTLGIDAVVDDSFLHEQPAVSHLSWIFSQKSRDVVAVALVSFELELRLYECEQIAVSLYLTGDPALFDFDLVFVAFEVEFARGVLELDAIAMALDDEVDLGGIDGDGALAGFEEEGSGPAPGEVDDGMIGVHFLFILHLQIIIVNTPPS